MKATNQLADNIERELEGAGTSQRAEKEKAYLKSELVHFGVPVPTIRRVVKSALRASGNLDRAELLRAVSALWERRVHELRVAAVELLHGRETLLEARDMELLERLIRESRTWALVDELAARVVGSLVEREPRLLRRLDRWSRDPDFWLRRAAMLALLLPLRRGEGDFERFARYADTMLEEREFFIRKAIGWVLRETSKKRPELVYAWLSARTERASKLTLREGSKYLGAAQRKKLGL